MKTKNMVFQILALIYLVVAAGCSKEADLVPDIEQASLAPFSIEFDNIVGERTLSLNNTANYYKNALGESFSISMLQYFISNIELENTDGKKYKVPQNESYFLISSDRASRFAKVQVPEGDYVTVRFTLGVDSLRSTMDLDKRKGVLDPAAGGNHDAGGMYWGWNSGYIFFKYEGNSPVISNDLAGDPTGKKQFKYHIGGFGGYNAPTINNIKTIAIDLKPVGIARVRKDRQSNVHLFVDVLKVFNGKHTFSIAAHPNVMFSEYSVNVAGNLTEMFRHDHTEN